MDFGWFDWCLIVIVVEKLGLGQFSLMVENAGECSA